MFSAHGCIARKMVANIKTGRSLMEILFCLTLLSGGATAQVLPLPDRATNAQSGSEFIRRIT